MLFCMIGDYFKSIRKVFKNSNSFKKLFTIKKTFRNLFVIFIHYTS